MNRILLAATILALAGCASTEDRPMNAGEETIVSEEVAQRVADAGGQLDTREEDDVVCDRIRKTGSHRVTRVCYTRAEKEAMDRATQNEMRSRYGQQRCLDRNLCGGG